MLRSNLLGLIFILCVSMIMTAVTFQTIIIDQNFIIFTEEGAVPEVTDYIWTFLSLLGLI
jgi:hypothetical protein